MKAGDKVEIIDDMGDIDVVVDWNDGYATEAMQTCDTVMNIICEELVDHPAVHAVGKSREMEAALDNIMEIYQEIGRLDE